MKHIIICLLAIATAGFAQSNKPVFAKGTMGIAFQSRVQAGASDVYSLNVNVADSVLFRGFVTNTPIIASDGIIGGPTIKRPSSLGYAVDLDVVNPNNPTQTKNIGKLYGVVPIRMNGTYDFNSGSVKVHVYATGRAPEYNSKYGGTAKGKAIFKQKNMMQELRQEAMRVTGQNKGKTTSLAVTNYDFMDFTQHRIAGGPVGVYPESTVDGRMVYDRDRIAWYFNGLTITYPQENMQKIDRLSGSVRWVEQPKKGQVREGEYQFDIRVNEPLATEASAFTPGGSDEQSFFEADTAVAAMLGTWKYRDSFSGEKVSQSTVAIDLVANKLTKTQVMNLTKLLLFTAAVPFNSE